MSSKRVRHLKFPMGCSLALLAGLAVWAFIRTESISADTTDERLPLAVIGDSDSHSYHDQVSFPANGTERGGPYRGGSFQWTEVLGKLRADEIDLGAWGTYGESGALAWAEAMAGFHDARSPRKQDYRYNFAVSGYGCDDIIGAPHREVPALAALMDSEPQRWQHGVVVIRIGVNSFATHDSLDRLAQDPRDTQVQSVIQGCVDVLQQSIALLRAGRPKLRIVLVGIFDNSNWSAYLERWQSPQSLANIKQGLDVFDDALRTLVQSDPQLAFFDDRAWFSRQWGGRDATGHPDYRSVQLGGLRVGNSQGDAPHNATLADGHAGTAWNGLWAQALVQLLNQRFHARLTPIREEEIVTLMQSPAVIQ